MLISRSVSLNIIQKIFISLKLVNVYLTETKVGEVTNLDKSCQVNFFIMDDLGVKTGNLC